MSEEWQSGGPPYIAYDFGRGVEIVELGLRDWRWVRGKAAARWRRRVRRVKRNTLGTCSLYGWTWKIT